MKPPFLTAQWRHLAMLQYEVDPALLRPLVPRGTDLDCWEGRALVSLVGFRFLDTRVLGISIPFHRHFDEVNLRFYVRRLLPATSPSARRAVVFIREIVPRHAIALVARWCYNEPYVALPMRHKIAMDGAEAGGAGRVRYEWRWRGAWHHLEAETEGPPLTFEPGSEAEFVTEHYWGYTSQRDGGCLEYEVQHAPWRIWGVRRAAREGDATTLYGSAFAEALSGRPVSAFVAEGSSVAVLRGGRLDVQLDPLATTPRSSRAERR